MSAVGDGPLSLLAEEVDAIASSRGWTVPTDFDEVDAIARKLCLVHSEVSEALEGLRVDDFDNFREELADVLIRVFHLAHGLGIDLDEEVRRKMDMNRERPTRHGGKRC